MKCSLVKYDVNGQRKLKYHEDDTGFIITL